MNQLKQLYDSAEHFFRRYRVTVFIALSLGAILLVATLLLALFVRESVAAARTTKKEVFEHDLQDAVVKLDFDERMTLQRNLTQLIPHERLNSPLILPRQYYSALQPGQRALPRLPPRNCFLKLRRENGSDTPDKFCSYFAENPTFGAFLFFVAQFEDLEPMPLKYGDRSLQADRIELQLSVSGQTTTWSIAPQQTFGVGRDRYQLTAHRILPTGIVELDRRVEGWALFQRQVLGTSKWLYIFRLDFREFAKGWSRDSQVWPPVAPSLVHVQLERFDVNTKSKSAHHIYAKNGTTELSVRELVAPLIDAHAEVAVQQGNKTVAQVTNGREPTSFVFASDIHIAAEPIHNKAALPDTDVILQASHPGIVIELRVWAFTLAMLFLLIQIAVLARYSYKRLLKPIFSWTSTAVSTNATNQPMLLNYANSKDEIGQLANWFNGLLLESHKNLARERLANARRAELLQMQQRNLQVIGHEINMPLQALSIILEPHDEGRRFLDRILRALPFLQQVYSPENSITSRKARLLRTDVVEFLRNIVDSAYLIDVENITFDTPVVSAEAEIDPEALEDVLENILRNAKRHRRDSTEIKVALNVENSEVSISISNIGDHIPEEDIERIFEFGFSTTSHEEGRVVGIGLSMAQHHVLEMGGTLTVANVGTDKVSFLIVLPLVS